MKMIVPTPRDWQRRAGAQETLLVSPEGDLVLVATTLFPALSDAGEWLRGVLAVPADAPLPLRVAHTEDGWKMTIAEPAGEPTIGAYIQVLDYAGGLIARCRDESSRAGWRDEALAMFRRGRPSFRQKQAACLLHQVLLGRPSSHSTRMEEELS